jgi:hypothetical protein
MWVGAVNVEPRQKIGLEYTGENDIPESKAGKIENMNSWHLHAVNIEE